MTKEATHIHELFRQALTESLHHNIKSKLEKLPSHEKVKYLEGYEEGLYTFKRIILADIQLGNMEVIIKKL